MSLRSRVSTTIDLGRLANAVARPGIDPRVWVSYAVLTSEPYIETVEGRQDVFVDLLLLPTQQPETARVGAIYAGNGFGFFTPLHKDDEVLVVAPSGDPNEGLVVTQRLWSPADPPPTELLDYPTDLHLVVEADKALRIKVSGGGKVYLGDNDGTKPVAHVDSETTPTAAWQTWFTTVGTALAAPPPTTTFATVTSGSSTCEVKP